MLGNFRCGNRTIVYIANGDVIAANEGTWTALKWQTPLPTPRLTVVCMCCHLTSFFHCTVSQWKSSLGIRCCCMLCCSDQNWSTVPVLKEKPLPEHSHAIQGVAHTHHSRSRTHTPPKSLPGPESLHSGWLQWAHECPFWCLTHTHTCIYVCFLLIQARP